MHLTFSHKTHETSNIYTFWFEKPSDFSYTAGQFITMHLPVVSPDERGSKHWFTLSSSPTDPLLSITTRWFGDKASTFKQMLFNLEPGTAVHIDPPDGDFILPDNVSKDIVLVAGGIGITPYHSMVKYLSDKGQKRKIHLVYAVKNKEDLAFLDLFDKYGCTLTALVNETLTGAKILEFAKNYSDKLFYISGPEPMVESLYDQLKDRMPKEQLKTDYFPGYQTI